MKKFYFLLMTLMIGLAAWSQTIKTWDGGASTLSWNDANNWAPDGVPAANAIVVFPTGISASITNVANTGSLILGGLRIEGNSNITLINTANDRTLTIANGIGTDFIIESGAGLTLGGGAKGVNIILATSTAGNVIEASIAGTLTVQNGRTYNTTNTYVHTQVAGTIDNRGNVSSNDIAEVTITGKYIHFQNGGNIPMATWYIESLCEITGITDIAPGMLNQFFGNFTWNCNNQSAELSTGTELENIKGNFTITNTNNQVLRPSSSNDVTLTVQRDFIINGAKALYVVQNGNGAGNIKTYSVWRDFIMSAGTLRMTSAGASGTAQLNIGNDFKHTGGTVTELGSGPASVSFYVSFFSGGVKTFTSGGTIANTINFTINSDKQVDFGTSVLGGSTGTFTLSSGAKIITANANGLRSTDLFGSIQVTGTRTFSNAADYEFKGGSTGTFTTTGNQVRDLIINNTTTNEVSAARNFIVNRALTLINGYLTTTAGQLTVNTAGTASTINGAFVNGPLAKMTNSIIATPFMLPVGKVIGGLREIGIITTAATASTFTAQFFRGTPLAGTLGAGLTQKSNCEYWDLGRSVTGSPAQVVLSWASGSPCGASSSYVTDPTTLRVAHLTGGVWVNEGRQGSTGTNTAGTITSGNTISTFSPFALASSSSATNPLPVLFANIKAYEKNNGVQIEWSNLTEKDVAEYTIERSANGSEFTAISQQLPISNQNDKANYSAFDASPIAGINYYRIKAEETTGKIVYSKVLSINLGITNNRLRLYPNPVTGNQVTVSLSNLKRGHYNLRVINTGGQDVLKQTITTQGSSLTQALELPSSVKPGVYNMVITGEGYRESKMFIVQ